MAHLIVQMVKKNATWGYNQTEGALENLGVRLRDTTLGNIRRGQLLGGMLSCYYRQAA